MAFPRTDKGGGLHQPQDHVHVLQGVLRHIDHIFTQFILCFMDSGGIQENDLSPLIRINRLYPVPGGLGLIRRNGDLLANEMVHQGGFSHIRPSYQGYKAGFLLCIFFHLSLLINGTGS